MTPEEYAENSNIFDNISHRQPIVVATKYKKLLISAEKMNITDINDIDAFNKAMYNDVLLNRTCLTSDGEYVNIPEYISYLYLCDISKVFNVLLDIYTNFKKNTNTKSNSIAFFNSQLQKNIIYKYCSDTHLVFYYDDGNSIKLTVDGFFWGASYFVLNTELIVRTLKLNDISELI